MKLMHLSDLHLGKRVNEFSMLEDQAYILEEILRILDEEKPEAVLIAGDVYDKSVPPAEAVQLFDDFLWKLSGRKLQVFVISGNHDSAERIAFGSRLMGRSGIHLSPVYDGKVEAVSLEDEYGPLHFYMLPFLKPANVRRYWGDAAEDGEMETEGESKERKGDNSGNEPETVKEIRTYTDALRIAIEKLNVDRSERNVLITHQFVTGALRSESEEISVGGTDNVDAGVFEGFDYVALGHLHRPQSVKESRIRYCGTPLKYSFSEIKDEKSVTVVEIGPKGSSEERTEGRTQEWMLAEIGVRTVPLKPLRDLREIRGSYMELTAKSFYEEMQRNGIHREDYFHIILTDEEDVPDAVGKLRIIYPNLMKLSYDNLRTRSASFVGQAEAVQRKSPLELFGELYEKQNNRPMSREQAEFTKGLIEKIWEGEK